MLMYQIIKCLKDIYYRGMLTSFEHLPNESSIDLVVITKYL